PMGGLSMPGSGFMPKLVAGLLVVFGLVLAARAGESQPFAAIDWSDLKHAVLVVLITAAAVALYTVLGFIITIALLVFGLLPRVGGRNVPPPALHSIAGPLLTSPLFDKALKAPLPVGPLGF